MKILIVDDEVLVRNGLKNSIHWEDLGISSVLLAEDGVQALRIARQEQPHIILTDVRMQRMDGIELAAKLSKLLPGSQLIFISGYSDKEYLKAAIQLKAVSYVEKPIICEEIEAAVAEAVRLVKEHSSNMDAQSVRSRMEKAQLATALTSLNPKTEPSIRNAWEALGLPAENKLWFSTILIKLIDIPDSSQLPGLADFLIKLQDIAAKRRLSFLYSTRRESKILLHLYCASELSRSNIEWFGLQLQKYLSNRTQFFIALGLPVRGINKIPLSYRSAVKTLNEGFYNEINACLLWNETPSSLPTIDFDSYISSFHTEISSAQFDSAKELETKLYHSILSHRQFPPDTIKNTYYQFISIMEWTSTKNCISFTAAKQEQSPWEVVSSCHTVSALHNYFRNLLDKYEQLFMRGTEENELVFIMKDYIRKNYHHDMLSVREIAEAACLSTAYACTMFKKETGTTINQFISNHRIERAKQLLADPRQKITDIASQLGFSDSNYFGKSFKRLVGLSPSEYREKVSQCD